MEYASHTLILSGEEVVPLPSKKYTKIVLSKYKFDVLSVLYIILNRSFSFVKDFQSMNTVGCHFNVQCWASGHLT